MRTALVTGASRGIGLAIAKELSGRGWALFLMAQDRQRLDAAAANCANVRDTLAVDLGDGEPAAESTRAWLTRSSSSLDLLVLNAGIFIEGPLADVGEEGYRRNMAVNLDANVFLTRALLGHLKRGRKPRIVIIGSTAAYESYPLVPTYGVAKWALRGFALNLRRELMSEGIGVTFLSPGGTLTDMWMGEDIEAGRLLEARDVAMMVCAICELSPQAVVEELVIRPMLGDIHE